MKLYLLIGLFLFNVGITFAQHWECVVHESDTWKYYPTTSSVSADWYKTSFNDASWFNGQGGFGYADGDDKTTTANVNSVYLRRKFTITDLNLFKELLLDIDYDDAFVCYLNDKEIARSPNLTAAVPVYNSSLSYDHEAKLYQGGQPERYNVPISSLRTGENMLSVQILNNGTGSSDLSARVFLNAFINGGDVVYGSVPYWFVAPTRYNLPLFILNTNGGTIVDEPKITADLKVINLPEGNSLSDTVYEFNGKIGIEIRGSSSQTYEKKNYAFETRDLLGNNLNVSLLGLPKENDWVLHGPYGDKSLMRNVLSFEVGNRMGRWAPHTKFCELFINGEYRGVYVLMEKIKVDKHRLDIANLKDSDLVGDELTGGYIMKVDREDPGYFNSNYPDRSGDYSIKFSYVDPSYENLKTVQREYIKQYIRSFETALYSFNYATYPDKYLEYADLESFVDYFIVQELAKNVDAYRLSAYFYKDKDSKGGKLTMGPMWDFNFTFGMPDYLDGWQTTDWVLTKQYWSIPFWWDKLRLDPRFNSKLKRRWTALRTNGVLQQDSLWNIVDSNYGLIKEAQARNFSKFPILSTYVWPNYYIAGTYINEINYMKNWIKGRLQWMDGQIYSIVDLFEAVDHIQDNSLTAGLYPNPSTGQVSLKVHTDAVLDLRLTFHDITGKLLSVHSFKAVPGINDFTVDMSGNSSPVLIYHLVSDTKTVISGKLIL